MIDSVTIKIPDKQFLLFEPDEHFSKTKYQELRGKFGVFGRYWARFTDHAKKLKKDGFYFPIVSVIYDERRRQGSLGTKRWLAIQVSVPKLLYGTNLFDVDERMLDLFAVRLTEQLRQINIVTEPKAVRQAAVQRIDFSKVLRIAQSFGEPSRIIKTLAGHDYKTSSDFNLNTHHNGRDDEKGHYVKFYNASQGFVIYDKFDEINVNGTTRLEQEIRKHYQSGKFTNGALRIELSLQRKQTVDSVLSRFISGQKKDFTLEQAFSGRISKALLVETFKAVYVDGFNGLLYLSSLKDDDLYRCVKEAVPNLKQRGLTYMLAHRVREKGLKETIAELRNDVSAATLVRYRAQIDKLLTEAAGRWDKVNIIGYLVGKLQRFTPVLPKGFERYLSPDGKTATNIQSPPS